MASKVVLPSKEVLMSMLRVKPGKAKMMNPTFGLCYQTIQGTIQSNFVCADSYNRMIANHVTAPNEIFIVGYPKTGNHFMKKVILEIMKHSKQIKDHQHYKQNNLGMHMIPWFEGVFSMEDPTYFNEFMNKTADCPRIWFNHSEYSIFPAAEIDPNTKIIYILRDPKDVLCSLAPFMNQLWWCEYSGSVQDLYRDFMNGLSYYGCYWDHVLSWDTARQFKSHQIHFVYYEDLINTPMDEVRKIMDFLNIKTKTSTYEYILENGEDDMVDIVNKIKYKNVVNELNENPGSFYEDFGLEVGQYFRKGIVGDHKNELNQEQIDEMDHKSYIKFSGTEVKYAQELQDLFDSISKKSDYVIE